MKCTPTSKLKYKKQVITFLKAKNHIYSLSKKNVLEMFDDEQLIN